MCPIVQAYPKYLHTKIAVRVDKNKYSNVDNSAVCISLLMGEGGGGEESRKGIPQTLHLDLPLHDVVGDSTYWY